MSTLASYFYRGRHRAPSRTTRSVVTVAALGAVAFAGAQHTAEAAEAPRTSPLDAIAQCESGGNYRAQNPRSSASGKYQFLDSTWREMGGKGRAKDASPAEQDMRAQKLYAQQGTTPWNASRDCWRGKTAASSGSGVKTPSRVTSKAKAANPTKKAPKASKVITSGRAADGTGTYVCDTAHLYFEACDPGNLGEVVNYPKYDRYR